MAEQNFPDRALYNLDNLDVLRGMNSETVDLIATDPPFNKKRNRSASSGQYEDAWRWADHPTMQKERPEQWKWQPVHRIWLDQIRDENEALFQVIEATRLTQDDDTAAFLCFLGVRLLEMRRVLKPTGSIYLHCDHVANGYIRMVMDAIFGKANFRNEIVWAYPASPSATRKDFPRKHDTIFRYSKTAEWTFNADAVRVPYAESSMERIKYPANASTVMAGNTIELQEGGKIPPTVWSDIQQTYRYRKERTGSPDQKPVALYERIIKASSNPGDLVLDPFCGCATTPIAAHNQGRRWVGIDRREDASFHIANRLLGLGINVNEFKVQQQALLDELQAHCEILSTPPSFRRKQQRSRPAAGLSAAQADHDAEGGYAGHPGVAMGAALLGLRL